MNQLQAYQFIQYNHLTTLENLKKVYDSGAIICFDFEDGIVDPMNSQNSEELKNEARKQFHRLYELLREYIADCSIGVRINSIHSVYVNDDYLALTEKTLEVILLPKIENTTDLNQNLQKLMFHNITCNKIIPIIETKKGFENFSEIIKSFGTIIKSYAFGHCDYNLILSTMRSRIL
jgi:citrate lyase beta subunit